MTAARVQPTAEQVLINDLWLTLQDAQAPLQAQIATLQAQVTTLQGQLATANGTIATQAKTITTRNATIKTLNAQVATLNSQIAALNATITSLRGQLATWPAACPAPAPCPACPVCPAPPAPPVVTPPPPPVLGSVSLAWDAVTGATGYRVYYGTGSGVYLQAQGLGVSTTATTFTVNGLNAGTYFLAVTAQNAQAESAYSNEVSANVTTGSPDTQAPTVPTGFTAVAISPTQVNLSWNASTDNVGVVGYYVYNGDTGSTLVIVRGVTSYSHTGLVPGSTHSYRVSGFDAVPNHSAWTDPPVSVTTPLQ